MSHANTRQVQGRECPNPILSTSGVENNNITNVIIITVYSRKVHLKILDVCTASIDHRPVFPVWKVVAGGYVFLTVRRAHLHPSAHSENTACRTLRTCWMSKNVSITAEDKQAEGPASSTVSAFFARRFPCITSQYRSRPCASA